MKITIKAGSKNKVTANFTESEIYKASYGYLGASFTLDEELLIGAQIIRDYFGVEATVTSSKRTKAHELSRGRSGKSQHILSAIDLSFPENVLLKYHKEILTKGPLFKKLRLAGINGFGLYDNFLHIDTRKGANKHIDAYGTYAFWDNRILSKKKV